MARSFATSDTGNNRTRVTSVTNQRAFQRKVLEERNEMALQVFEGQCCFFPLFFINTTTLAYQKHMCHIVLHIAHPRICYVPWFWKAEWGKKGYFLGVSNRGRTSREGAEPACCSAPREALQRFFLLWLVSSRSCFYCILTYMQSNFQQSVFWEKLKEVQYKEQQHKTHFGGQATIMYTHDLVTSLKVTVRSVVHRSRTKSMSHAGFPFFNSPVPLHCSITGAFLLWSSYISCSLAAKWQKTHLACLLAKQIAFPWCTDTMYPLSPFSISGLLLSHGQFAEMRWMHRDLQ